jgi:putative pyruvate formate lyase activating enzyme
MGCVLCPRRCNIDRAAGAKGFCQAGWLPRVALADLHFWEEPCISGTRGSGAVFFSRCNLACAFCQNHEISQPRVGEVGRELDAPALKEVFFALEARGAHNINLVSPTHYAGVIAEAIEMAKKEGIRIPFVYNSNGYDSMEGLRLMDGLIDVYLPDLKYHSDVLAMRYSSAPSYFRHATSAILEMARQVGTPVFDSAGMIRKGLIVRHLVLPGNVEDSKAVLRWIKYNLPAGTFVSIMSQYYPVHRAWNFPELSRKLRADEYEEVVEECLKIGLEDGYFQELSSAVPEYTPDFLGEDRRSPASNLSGM